MKVRCRFIPCLMIAAAVIGAILPGVLSAQLPPQPGRIRLAFGGLTHRAVEVSHVTLDGAMLKLGIRMLLANEQDARVRQVLSRLRGVYMKSFRFAAKGRYSSRDLAAIRRQLQAPGWEHIMGVRSHLAHRSVNIYVMSTRQGFMGMVIIAQYPRKLQVVNLVGPINPAAFSRLGGHFGIPRVKVFRNHPWGGHAAPKFMGKSSNMRRQP